MEFNIGVSWLPETNTRCQALAIYSTVLRRGGNLIPACSESPRSFAYDLINERIDLLVMKLDIPMIRLIVISDNKQTANSTA